MSKIDSSKVRHCDFHTSNGSRVRRRLHTTDKREALQKEAELKLKAEDKQSKGTLGFPR